MRAAVLGAGSWGTAYAAVLADAGTKTTLWARRPDLAETLGRTRENPEYLPGIGLPESLAVTSDPGEAMDDSDFVVLAIPSQTLRENLAVWVNMIPRHAILVSLMKGIELGTTKRMSEVIQQVADVGPERVAIVSGPNLAKEIAAKQPTATVIASVNSDAATALQQASVTGYFRPYTNLDVIGCELGGAVKNVIALAVGMAEGMGFGDNTRAALITRGLAETARLGVALGADLITFSGLAGLGDLVATCSSPLSRNRTVGEQLGRGKSLEQVMNEMRMVAEGVKSSQSILALAHAHDVDVPIIEHVVKVLYEGLTPTEMLRSLMSREAKPE